MAIKPISMLLVVNFDIKASERQDAFFKLIKELGENIVFIPHSLFLHTDLPDRNLVYKKLKGLLNDEDLLLISQVDLDSISGWLSSSVVEWLKTRQ